ncbi:hydroxymethylpyrimidine/phosphomethylpyrimidine kinase [Sunxiuqinia indica]|uniref:hydroxymethylpyrimidine/phosphomethylpyrimidine kinase n=1 Tax=Sunxiuqinia indica TaxID=2692584 RepID=UPI00135B39A4|nr:hydroxymethylpyrimidine/phosphomethylpyrimidine kinase [Sunxiuqinia indica]
MSTKRPDVICLSGFDPSGGAGILADIKTLEMHRVQGLGVCTALTFQNDQSFEGMEWVSEKNMLRQLDVLQTAYQPKAVKIGIIESLSVLMKAIEKLKHQDSDISIIWDPILNASAGFNFHQQFDRDLFDYLLDQISLLTPNLPECEYLFGTSNVNVIREKVNCAVLIKGGHSESDFATDVLIAGGEQQLFRHEKKMGFSKHGTGCILSSAIAANLALGRSLAESCRLAKEYMQAILTSNHTKLAYHYEP